MRRILDPYDKAYEEDARRQARADEWETMMATREQEIMTRIEALIQVRDRREEILETTINEIMERTLAIRALEAQATKWELGISGVEATIEELENELANLEPLDMTATGEGDDGGPEGDREWAANGFILSED